MKTNRSLPILILLMFALLLPAAAPAENAEALGSPMPDFTVTATDGSVFTLSEVLKDKEAVLVKIFATWCGPCLAEFPVLNELYETYGDRVGFVALSGWPEDTPEVLAQYVQDNGITFPVARDEGDVSSWLDVTAYPTLAVVDRFGNVCLLTVGAHLSADPFVRLFDVLLSEDYTQTVLFDDMPEPEAPADPGEKALSDALNLPGGTLVFRTPDGTWPMLPDTADGRVCVIPSNLEAEGYPAAVACSLVSAEGDALVFDFATDTEAAIDLLTLYVDGASVKSFGGTHGWTRWAVPLEAGEHTVIFAFLHVPSAPDAASVYLSGVGLLSGDEAAAALSALPELPVADEFRFTVLTPGSRPVVFNDPEGFLSSYLGDYTACVVNDESATVRTDITAETDPESAFLSSDYDGCLVSIASCLNPEGDAYVAATWLDSLATTSYPYTVVSFYPSLESASADPYNRRCLLLFRDEENLEAFVEQFADVLGEDPWRYADDPADPAAESGQITYTVLFTDADGNPVPGCAVNFCTSDSCQLVFADEQGEAVLTGDPYPYHVQVVIVPEGYAFDLTQEFTLDAGGETLRLTLTQEQ